MKKKSPVILLTKEKPFKECSSIKEFVKHYGLSFCPYRRAVNKLALPNNRVPANDDGMKIFNEAIRLCVRRYRRPKLIRTPSGGIMRYSDYGFGFDVTKASVTLIYYGPIESIYDTGFRLTFGGTVKGDGQSITGRGAFRAMVAEFAKDGIDLYSYAIENGEEVKKEIKKPKIELDPDMKLDTTYRHVNHLDLHSAYPSGLALAHPELRPTIERIYENRKRSDKDKSLKLQLDASMGYFQSKFCTSRKVRGKHCVLAHLAKDGVNWCRDTMERIAKELKAQKKKILAFNTDGVWYVDKKSDFHSDLIGEGLGKAGIDHVDCQIRFKSKGSYEFIENGVYKPVVRGLTKLDRIKDRKDWEWGDIYQDEADPSGYRWNPESYEIESQRRYDDKMTDEWLEENKL